MNQRAIRGIDNAWLCEAGARVLLILPAGRAKHNPGNSQNINAQQNNSTDTVTQVSFHSIQTTLAGFIQLVCIVPTESTKSSST